jgi:hypothetical protein
MVLMTMVLMVTVGMAIAVMVKAVAGKKVEMATGADLAKAHRKEGRGGVHHSLLLPQEFNLASPLGCLSSSFGWWQG